MIPWAIFLLVTLIRTISRRKIWTKPWVVFVFASGQLLFGFIITYALTIFKGPIVDALSGVEQLSSFATTLQNTDLTFKTSCFIPSILYVAMIILVIPYMIFCHKIKKDYKQHKRDKRAAKRGA